MSEKISKPTISTVAKINNTEIVVIQNGEKKVAVKPICEALGVDFSSQLQKLKEDPILSSTMVLNTTVGADGKEREMVTIPFKFVFGWLFRIDSRNVKEEAREAVLRYQVECYNALYSHFTAHMDFVEYQRKTVEEQLTIVEALNHQFHSAKDQLVDAKEELNRRRKLTFEQWKEVNAQLKLFPEQEV